MTTVAPNVLIAENDDVARLFLADNLEADGYRPVCAADTPEALELLSATPDVLIVDVNGDTLGVIDAIRERTYPTIDPNLPILVLTSRTDELHRTRILERGADDVLCKPYSYPELRARLGAVLRRANARRSPHLLRAGSLRLDVRSRRAWVGEVEVEPLRDKEYQLLLTLITEPERVLTDVNLEPRKPQDAQGDQGNQGSEMGWWSPFPAPGRLTAAPRVRSIRRMPAGYGKECQAARGLALLRAHYRCERCARRPPEVVLVVHHVDECGVGGRRAFDQTNLRVLCRGCH